MRGKARGYAVLLAGVVILGYATPASAVTVDTRAPRFVSEDVSVGETPNSVAAADSGLIVASLYNERSIILLPGAGVVTRVPLECSPSDVAIAPDASTAWAVCQGDPHLYVIDVASGEPLLADVGLREANGIVYLPALKQLVIADLAGEVVVVSATSVNDYAVLERVPTGAQRPSDLVMLPSGGRGFATTDAGLLLSIDITAGTSRLMSGQAPQTFLSSLALSRSGTILYAGAAIGSNSAGFRSAILALDPVTGATVQESALTFTTPGSTTIEVAAGHRSLSVATGLEVDIEGESTGLFDIALDERGRMGARSRIMPPGVSVLGTDVSRSSDGSRLAAGTTNARVVGALIEDPAYSPTLSVQGKLKGNTLTLTGTSTSMQPGTVVTVHIKDLTKRGQMFVTQPATAVIDAQGNYRWKGTVKPVKVRVFTKTSSPAVSPMVTISREKR